MDNILTSYFLKSKRWIINASDHLHSEDLTRINAVNRVRLPSSEDGAFETVGKVFDIDMRRISVETLSAKKVWEEDKSVVDVYCREKKLSENIDVQALTRTFNFFDELTGITLISFLPIIDYDFCYNVLPKSTSSGFPFYYKKNDPKNISSTFESFNFFFSEKEIRKLWDFITYYPTTIFHRFTPKAVRYRKGNFLYLIKYKIRQVFGVSHIVSLLEVSLLYRYLEVIKSGISAYTTIGLNKVEVSSRISTVRSCARSTNRKVYCGDIQGCDRSILPNFHYAFFGPLIEKARDTSYYSHLVCLVEYLTNTPILMKGGKVCKSYGSTTSGSWTTTIFNTFCVFIVCSYSFYLMYNRFPKPNELQVQGDDFIMLIYDDDDMKIIKPLFLEFNLRLKADTVNTASHYEPIEFLGYFWDLLSSPYQTDIWVITRVLFPERRVELSGPDRIIYRYLSIIFQLRNYLDLFKRFLIHDKFLKRKIKGNKDPSFQIVDSVGVIHDARWPISRFLDYGWRMY